MMGGKNLNSKRCFCRLIALCSLIAALAHADSAKQDTLRLDDKDDGLDFVGNALNIFWNGCCLGAGFLKMFN